MFKPVTAETVQASLTQEFSLFFALLSFASVAFCVLCVCRITFSHSLHSLRTF